MAAGVLVVGVELSVMMTVLFRVFVELPFLVVLIPLHVVVAEQLQAVELMSPRMGSGTKSSMSIAVVNVMPQENLMIVIWEWNWMKMNAFPIQ
jgi:hypothetical protein